MCALAQKVELNKKLAYKSACKLYNKVHITGISIIRNFTYVGLLLYVSRIDNGKGTARTCTVDAKAIW